MSMAAERAASDLHAAGIPISDGLQECLNKREAIRAKWDADRKASNPVNKATGCPYSCNHFESDGDKQDVCFAPDDYTCPPERYDFLAERDTECAT